MSGVVLLGRFRHRSSTPRTPTAHATCSTRAGSTASRETRSATRSASPSRDRLGRRGARRSDATAAARQGRDRRSLRRAVGRPRDRRDRGDLERTLQPPVPSGVRRDSASVPEEPPAGARRAEQRRSGARHLPARRIVAAQRRLVHDELRTHLRTLAGRLPGQPPARHGSRRDPVLRTAEVGSAAPSRPAPSSAAYHLAGEGR
jgi:hypothetical protein